MRESYVHKYCKIYYFFLVHTVYDTTLHRIDKIVDNITLSLGMHVKVRIEKKKNIKTNISSHLCYNSFVLFECHIYAV